MSHMGKYLWVDQPFASQQNIAPDEAFPLTRCSQLPTAYVQWPQERHPVAFAQANQMEQYLLVIWPAGEVGHQPTLLVSFPLRSSSYAMYPNINYRMYGAGPPIRDFQFSISGSLPHISGHNWPVSDSSIAFNQTLFWVPFERDTQFTDRKDVGCQAISPIHWALQPCPAPNCHYRLTSDLTSWNEFNRPLLLHMPKAPLAALRNLVNMSCSLVVLPVSQQIVSQQVIMIPPPGDYPLRKAQR